jgi:hybrid cluster-associated redox disulfide protein
MTHITKDMTIAEVLQIDAGTAPVFMQYGMHCLTCPVSVGESIKDAAAVHGVDVDALVKALNDYLGGKAE